MPWNLISRYGNVNFQVFVCGTKKVCQIESCKTQKLFFFFTWSDKNLCQLDMLHRLYTFYPAFGQFRHRVFKIENECGHKLPHRKTSREKDRGLTHFKLRFSNILSALGRVFKFSLSPQNPFFKFLSVLSHNFPVLHSRVVIVRYNVCCKCLKAGSCVSCRAPKMRCICVLGSNFNCNPYPPSPPLPKAVFSATVQKRFTLNCWNVVTSTVSLLHIIRYTF